MMKLDEIKGKDTRELRLDLQALRKEMFELRIRSVSEEIQSPARFRQIKKTIARIHTVIRQREIASAATSGQANQQQQTPAAEAQG